MNDYPEKQNSRGVVVRGANGELYFLRDELLEAAKMTEPEMKEFIEGVVADKFKENPQRFTVNLGNIHKAVPIEGPLAPIQFDARAASTVMCPGTMGFADFEVIIDDDF